MSSSKSPLDNFEHVYYPLHGAGTAYLCGGRRVRRRAGYRIFYVSSHGMSHGDRSGAVSEGCGSSETFCKAGKCSGRKQLGEGGAASRRGEVLPPRQDAVSPCRIAVLPRLFETSDWSDGGLSMHEFHHIRPAPGLSHTDAGMAGYSA